MVLEGFSIAKFAILRYVGEHEKLLDMEKCEEED